MSNERLLEHLKEEIARLKARIRELERMVKALTNVRSKL